ncbi:hypothetical protein LXL04_020882 [Taraxacum kok-saghyz]
MVINQASIRNFLQRFYPPTVTTEAEEGNCCRSFNGGKEKANCSANYRGTINGELASNYPSNRSIQSQLFNKRICAVMLSNTAKSSGIKPEIAMTIPKRCNIIDRPVGYRLEAVVFCKLKEFEVKLVGPRTSIC